MGKKLVTATILLLIFSNIVSLASLKIRRDRYMSLKRDVYISSRVSYWDLIKKYSLEYGIPPEIPASVQVHETGYIQPHLRHKAVSVCGAIGLMQIMPFHAKGFGYSVNDLYNPKINIQISVRILAGLYKKYHKNTDKVFAAYNGGDTQARLKNKNRCSETRNYVILTQKTYKEFLKIK